MDVQNQQTITNVKAKKHKYLHTRSSRVVSFSAKLPADVRSEFQDCICAVKYSNNPFYEIRESIIEVIQNVGVRDWKQMEELIYCYIALNSSEVHHFIEDAFLSL